MYTELSFIDFLCVGLRFSLGTLCPVSSNKDDHNHIGEIHWRSLIKKNYDQLFHTHNNLEPFLRSTKSKTFIERLLSILYPTVLDNM